MHIVYKYNYRKNAKINQSIVFMYIIFFIDPLYNFSKKNESLNLKFRKNYVPIM